jgi:hypothetical protein
MPKDYCVVTVTAPMPDGTYTEKLRLLAQVENLIVADVLQMEGLGFADIVSEVTIEAKRGKQRVVEVVDTAPGPLLNRTAPMPVEDGDMVPEGRVEVPRGKRLA